MSVPAQIERDHFFLAARFALQRLVNRDANRVRRFRRGYDPFGARELHARREDRVLLHRDRFDEFLIVQRGDDRCHAVIAQPARVNGRRHKR